MADHAVIGSYRLTFHVPASLHEFRRFRHSEAVFDEGLAEPTDLHHARRVGNQDSATTKTGCGVWNHLPWFG